MKLLFETDLYKPSRTRVFNYLRSLHFLAPPLRDVWRKKISMEIAMEQPYRGGPWKSNRTSLILYVLRTTTTLAVISWYGAVRMVMMMMMLMMVVIVVATYMS